MFARTVLAATALALSPATVRADLMFSAAGNDLVVTITAPIVFNVNVPDTDAFFGISIEDAYTSSQASFFVDPHTGDASMTLNAAPTTTTGAAAGISNGAGVFGLTDLFLFWDFVVDQTLAVSDTVTVSAGTRTVPNLIGSGGIVPDSLATSLDVVLFEGDAAAQIAPAISVARVPEPSSFALLGLVSVAVAGCHWSRRR